MTEKIASITPGPWKLGYSDGSGARQNDWESEEGFYITDPLDNEIVRGGEDEGIPIGVLHEGDAKLIAAAPTLLNACKAVLSYIRSHQIYDKDARGVLERAIWEAEGDG